MSVSRMRRRTPSWAMTGTSKNAFPVQIAVGFGVSAVTQLSPLCDLRLQFHRVGRAVGTVEHDDPVGSGEEPKVTTHPAGVREYVAGDLL